MRLRPLLRTPGFAALAVLTLALGVGAGTALFSVTRAVLLRPFPFAEQDRLAILWTSDLERNQPFSEISYPAYRDWRERARVFEDLAAMPATNLGATLTGHGDPRQIQFRPVTPNFFDVLGSRPLAGRTFEPGETARVAVISHGLWQRLLGGQPSALGSTLGLDGDTFEVIGVMPRAFTYPEGAEFWTPLTTAVPAGLLERREVGWLLAIGRLQPETSFDQARDAMNAIVRDLGRAFPGEAGHAPVVRPVVADILGDTRLSLLLLAGAVGLVLIIACGNVTNLLLARAMGRQREMATRLALGATPARLVAQIVGEMLPLGVAGAAGGLVLGWITLEALAIAETAGLPRGGDIAIDGAVAAFAAAVSLAAVLLSAALPAVRAAHSAALPITSAARTGDARRVSRTRDLLAAGEIALAVIVAIGAALVARTFVELQRADLGFDPAGVLTAEIGLGPARSATPATRNAALEEIRARIAAHPGVERAAFVFLRPLWGRVGFDWPFQAEGQTPEEAARNPGTNFETATPGYFAAMGIRRIDGRDFTPDDDADAPGAVIVSERLASRMWPGQRAVGRRIKGPGLDAFSNQWLTIVGVVEDARYREIEAARYDVYMAHRQAPMPMRHLVVQTRLERPEVLTPVLRAIVRDVDPAAFVDDARSMQSIVEDALAGRRLRARLFLSLAAIAVLLAIGGVYGVMSYGVAQQRRELAVRAALGAGRQALVRLVFGRGLVIAALGIAAGVAGALILSGLAQSLLAGVSARDPMMFASAAGAIAVAALSACYLPARRASRANAADALRL